MTTVVTRHKLINIIGKKPMMSSATTKDSQSTIAWMSYGSSNVGLGGWPSIIHPVNHMMYNDPIHKTG